MILMPKKRSRGPCNTDDFRGISLVSVPYKALCMIVKERLALVVEERKLVAEEQGGFRKWRDYDIDAIGTVSAVRKAGMMAAFINFKKAYDIVDRSKLWKCLEQMELKGRLGVFLQELYRGVECEVRVGEYLSEPFEVTSGLRQGCVLSPLLFSLYFNGAVEKVRAAKVGIMCREKLVPALLFIDHFCGKRFYSPCFFAFSGVQAALWHVQPCTERDWADNYTVHAP